MGDINKIPLKQYIDAETGEYVSVDKIVNEYCGQKPFWKVYKKEFVSLLRKYDGKQKDVLLYIIEHVHQTDNSVKFTYKTLSKELKTSEVTIAKAVTSLQDDMFITIESLGVWRVNPNFLVRGSDQKRSMLSKIFFDLWNLRDIIRKKKHTNAEENDDGCN